MCTQLIYEPQVTQLLVQLRDHLFDLERTTLLQSLFYKLLSQFSFKLIIKKGI